MIHSGIWQDKLKRQQKEDHSNLKMEDNESSLLKQKLCSGDVIVQAEMSFTFQTPCLSGAYFQ